MKGKTEKRILGITEEEFGDRLGDALCRCVAEAPAWGILRAIVKEEFLMDLIHTMYDDVKGEFFPEEDDDKIFETMSRAMDRAMATVGEPDEDEHNGEEGNNEEDR